MTALSSVKSSHWSITFFPSDEFQSSEEEAIRECKRFVSKPLPPGWAFGDANVERCPKTGKYHWQGYLKSLYVRGSEVKSVLKPDMPHIEKTRNKLALVNYANKTESRVDTIAAPQGVPTPWEYIDVIAKKWDHEEFSEAIKQNGGSKMLDDIAMAYVDHLVSKDIEDGVRGVEFIAVNPMFRSAWKKFWSSIIVRNARSQKQSSCEEAPAGLQDVSQDREEGSEAI